MNVDLDGAVEVLGRWYSLADVPRNELRDALASAPEPLRVRILPESRDPFIRAGEPVDHVVLLTAGRIAPWQVPISDLKPPFLLGEHELLLADDRDPIWISHYSAAIESQVIEIPVATMRRLLQREDVLSRVYLLLLRRMTRYIWTSHSTTGDPQSRVASALVSRIFLRDLANEDQPALETDQRELMRLTAASRATVSKGLAELEADGIIEWDVRRARTDDEPRRRVVVQRPHLLLDRAVAHFSREILGKEW